MLKITNSQSESIKNSEILHSKNYFLSFLFLLLKSKKIALNFWKLVNVLFMKEDLVWCRQVHFLTSERRGSEYKPCQQTQDNDSLGVWNFHFLVRVQTYLPKTANPIKLIQKQFSFNHRFRNSGWWQNNVGIKKRVVQGSHSWSCDIHALNQNNYKIVYMNKIF